MANTTQAQPLTYEAWRISFQSSESAARAAFTRIAELEAQAASAAEGRGTACEFPAMSPDLEKILGTMCFECIVFVQCFRMAGQQIARKAEAEQAATLHWMLSHYFRSGEGWRTAAQADMERMRASVIAAPAKGNAQL